VILLHYSIYQLVPEFRSNVIRYDLCIPQSFVLVLQFGFQSFARSYRASTGLRNGLSELYADYSISIVVLWQANLRFGNPEVQSTSHYPADNPERPAFHGTATGPFFDDYSMLNQSGVPESV
jgi:hypothetical protein